MTEPVDRVRRPEEYDEFMKKLTDKANGGVFDTYKELMVFAACLGFSRDASRAFSKTAEPVAIHVFRGKIDLSIMAGIALLKDSDLEILSDDRLPERIRVFEGYVCGGLDLLKDRLENSSDYAADIVAMISEEFEEPHNVVDDITKLF